ncbi:hypothetical protein [Actibacterium sp. D379-3]
MFGFAVEKSARAGVVLGLGLLAATAVLARPERGLSALSWPDHAPVIVLHSEPGRFLAAHFGQSFRIIPGRDDRAVCPEGLCGMTKAWYDARLTEIATAAGFLLPAKQSERPLPATARILVESEERILPELSASAILPFVATALGAVLIWLPLPGKSRRRRG